MTLHIGIIGAGIIGLSCAYELLRHGFKVTILDDNDPNQASRAALGLSVIKGNFYARDELFALKCLGHKSFATWVESIAYSAGVPKTELLNSGLFEKFHSTAEYQAQSERAFHGEFTALHRMTCSSEQGCANQVPFTRYFPSDAHANVPMLQNALKTIVLKSGSWENVSASRFSELGNVSVQANDQNFPFDGLIIAAGAKTGELLRQSGYFSPALQNVPGHSACFENFIQPKPMLTQISKFTISAFPTHTRIGSRAFDGEIIDENKSREALRFLAIDEQNVRWLFGIRTRQASRLPYVQGAESHTGKQSRKVLIATGMYRNGFQFAPLVSRFAMNFFKSIEDRPQNFSAETLCQL